MLNKLAVIVLLGGLLLSALISIGILVVQGARSMNSVKPSPTRGAYLLYEERSLYYEAQIIDVRQTGYVV
jgi:hypothetical protein